MHIDLFGGGFAMHIVFFGVVLRCIFVLFGGGCCASLVFCGLSPQYPDISGYWVSFLEVCFPWGREKPTEKPKRNPERNTERNQEGGLISADFWFAGLLVCPQGVSGGRGEMQQNEPKVRARLRGDRGGGPK